METTDDKKCIFQASAESVRLKRRLLELEVDDLITYPEISKLIGSNPQAAKGRAIVYSAMKSAMREKQFIFGCVAKEGYKRLDDVGITEASTADLRGIRKRSGHSANKLACADPTVLSQSQRVTYHGTATVLAFIRATTATKRIKAIEGAVAAKNGVLDVNETLTALA